MKKYYSIIAKCGHVGANKYIDINFPIIASSEEDAIKIISVMPRVKKGLANFITRFSEITYEQYLEMEEAFKNNNYLKCTSDREQKDLCPNIDKEIKTLKGIWSRETTSKFRKNYLKQREYKEEEKDAKRICRMYMCY